MKFKCQGILHNVRSISERTGAFRSVWNLLDCLGDLIHNIPIGYPAFVKAWNEGTNDSDTHHFSTIFLANDPDYNEVIPSTHPLRLSDFHIDPKQLGASSEGPPKPDPDQDIITGEFGIMMAAQQKRQREFAEERRQKKVTAGHILKKKATVFKRRNKKRFANNRRQRSPSSSPEPQDPQESQETQEPQESDTIESDEAEQPEDPTPPVDDEATPMEINT